MIGKEIFSNEYFMKILDILKNKNIQVKLDAGDILRCDGHFEELKLLINDIGKNIFKIIENDFNDIFEYVLYCMTDEQREGKLSNKLCNSQYIPYSFISDFIFEFILLKHYPDKLSVYENNISPGSKKRIELIKNNYKKTLENINNGVSQNIV